MSYKLILLSILVFSIVSIQLVILRDTPTNTDILAAYISLPSSNGNTLEWIDDVMTRIDPIRHANSLTHLILTLQDCESIRVRLVLTDKCTSTTIHSSFSCDTNKEIDEYTLLTFALDLLYNDTTYSDILSFLRLTQPKYSVLTVIPTRELVIYDNQMESILNRVYGRYPDSFNTVIFIINESISSHHKFYGSQQYEDTYEDGTGFNEALTVKNIPVSDRYTSLQYNLLYNGVYTRIASVTKVDSSRNFLFNLFVHFFTNYFVSNDEFSHFDATNSENCIDTLLCDGYTRSACEDDVINKITPKQLEKVIWRREEPFSDYLFQNNEVKVLKNTSVLEWRALEKFTFENLTNIFTQEEYHDVKQTNSKLTFDPDMSNPKLKSNITLPYKKITLSRDRLSQSFTQDTEHSHYLFTKLSPSLLPYFTPGDMLFHTYEDFVSSQQFLWISSRGLATHLHIDMDWNCFVQIRGKKRFTLFPPTQHELMYMYPRVHPMWHKSRIDLDHFSNQFPNFLLSSPLQVTLEPGDLLFIPGYTWHYVESLTSSISLSTWSHDYQLKAHMEAVYGLDHKFDLLRYKQGKIAALRLYIDMLVNNIVGVGRTKQFLGRLLSNRYHGLEHLFTREPTQLCDPNIIPTAQHIIGYTHLDVDLVSQHLMALSPVARDIFLSNYLEEISAEVVGANQLFHFFTECFANQTYYRTDVFKDTDIWQHM